MIQDTMNHETIYSFALPNVAKDVKFTCVLCGGPAISELEFYDEVVCDACYERDARIRREIDSQYRFSKEGEHWLGIAKLIEEGITENAKYCDGQCEKCGKSWGDES